MTNRIIDYNNLAQCANELMEAERGGGEDDVGVGVYFVCATVEFTLQASLKTLFKWVRQRRPVMYASYILFGLKFVS